MAFAPFASWNSRSITHLASCRSPSLPMNSSDESFVFKQPIPASHSSSSSPPSSYKRSHLCNRCPPDPFFDHPDLLFAVHQLNDAADEERLEQELDFRQLRGVSVREDEPWLRCTRAGGTVGGTGTSGDREWRGRDGRGRVSFGDG